MDLAPGTGYRCTARPGGTREGGARAGTDVTFSWLLKMSISCSLDLVSFSTSSSCSRSCWRASSFASKALLSVRSESPVSEKHCKVRKPPGGRKRFLLFFQVRKFSSVKGKRTATPTVQAVLLHLLQLVIEQLLLRDQPSEHLLSLLGGSKGGE